MRNGRRRNSPRAEPAVAVHMLAAAPWKTLSADCWAVVAQRLCTTDALALLITCTHMLESLCDVDEVWTAHANAFAHDQLVHDSILDRPHSEGALHRLLRLRDAKPLRFQHATHRGLRKDPVLLDAGCAAQTQNHGSYFIDLPLPRLAVDESLTFVLYVPDDGMPGGRRAFHNLVLRSASVPCTSSAEERDFGGRVVDYIRTQMDRMGVDINDAGLRYGRYLVTLVGIGSARAARCSRRAALAGEASTSGGGATIGGAAASGSVATRPEAATYVTMSVRLLGRYGGRQGPRLATGPGHSHVMLGRIAADQPLGAAP